MEPIDLVSLGELLIDFVATGTGPLRSAPGFIKAAGGAPANVAVAAARLGCRAGFIGAVGRDEFGSFLKAELEKNRVDVRGLQMLPRAPTPLAFVSLKENAERDFLFYWRNTADHLMDRRRIPLQMVRAARVFHYGSISLINPATRRATRSALQAALGARHTLVSCDPNLRLNLWSSADKARASILKTLESVHLVKVNKTELRFLTGSRGLRRGLRSLSMATDAAVLVTSGAAGATFHWGGLEGEVPGFHVDAIDTTGAGDGFVAGFLSCLLRETGSLRELKPDASALRRWVRYANAVGALTATRRGAIPAFPTPAEVASLIGESPG